MIVDVAFLPMAAVGIERKVCVVIDALRASASIVAMLDAGAPEILLAATVDEARRLVAAARARYWLVGEVGGQPPADFDHGNSPTELRAADLRGREVVFATSNGTRALVGLAAAPAVFVGGVVNGSAIAARAVDEAARRGLGLEIVCSGDDGGTLLSLEDLASAGVLVELILARFPRRVAAEAPEAAAADVVALDESAEAARRLYRSFLAAGVPPLPPDPAALVGAFDAARHRRYLARVGYEVDVRHCRHPDSSRALPLLARRGERLAIVPAP